MKGIWRFCTWLMDVNYVNVWTVAPRAPKLIEFDGPFLKIDKISRTSYFSMLCKFPRFKLDTVQGASWQPHRTSWDLSWECPWWWVLGDFLPCIAKDLSRVLTMVFNTAQTPWGAHVFWMEHVRGTTMKPASKKRRDRFVRYSVKLSQMNMFRSLVELKVPQNCPQDLGVPFCGINFKGPLFFPRGKAAALLKNNSCTSYGFMEQAASVPCCRWDPCQSSNPCHAPRMPCWGVPHWCGWTTLNHVRPEVCLMCFVPTVTEDSWDIVPSAMCFVLLNIGTAPPGPGGRGDHMISEGQALKAS